MKLEIYRQMIPTNKMMTENNKVNYRVHQGKLAYLDSRTKNLISGFEKGIGGFVVPDKEKIKQITDNVPFKMILEIWKFKNILFDVQNYAKSYKAQIDVFTSMGYLNDDNWKNIYPIIMVGGGRDAWDRAYRYKNDGLPDELTSEWWKDHGNLNDSLLRIIIDSDTNF